MPSPVHEAEVRPGKAFQVEDGAPGDACPLCGILRVHAGWIAATCGDHLQQPGCFVRELFPAK